MVAVLEDEEGEGSGLLSDVAERVGFEMVVGKNGRVWVDAKSVEDIWRVARCFQAFDDEEMWEREGGQRKCKEMVRKVFGR